MVKIHGSDYDLTDISGETYAFKKNEDGSYYIAKLELKVKGIDFDPSKLDKAIAGIEECITEKEEDISKKEKELQVYKELKSEVEAKMK